MTLKRRKTTTTLLNATQMSHLVSGNRSMLREDIVQLLLAMLVMPYANPVLEHLWTTCGPQQIAVTNCFEFHQSYRTTTTTIRFRG